MRHDGKRPALAIANSELAEALKLADKLLDVPLADPDDDIRVLSRQLLRQQERVVQLKAALRDIAAGWTKEAMEMQKVAQEALTPASDAGEHGG